MGIAFTWASASKLLGWEKLRTTYREGTATERALLVATLATVALGLLLRARGVVFSTTPLWLDEAFWAVRLIEAPLKEHLIRASG